MFSFKLQKFLSLIIQIKIQQIIQVMNVAIVAQTCYPETHSQPSHFVAGSVDNNWNGPQYIIGMQIMQFSLECTTCYNNRKKSLFCSSLQPCKWPWLCSFIPTSGDNNFKRNNNLFVTKIFLCCMCVWLKDSHNNVRIDHCPMQKFFKLRVGFCLSK